MTFSKNKIEHFCFAFLKIKYQDLVMRWVYVGLAAQKEALYAIVAMTAAAVASPAQEFFGDLENTFLDLFENIQNDKITFISIQL